MKTTKREEFRAVREELENKVFMNADGHPTLRDTGVAFDGDLTGEQIVLVASRDCYCNGLSGRPELTGRAWLALRAAGLVTEIGGLTKDAPVDPDRTYALCFWASDAKYHLVSPRRAATGVMDDPAFYDAGLGRKLRRGVHALTLHLA